MAVVQLDFFAPNDLNGDVLWTMTDEDDFFEELELRIPLYGLGGGRFVTSRQIGEAMFNYNENAHEAFLPEVFVRAVIPEVSATKYQWGFFLDLRKQVLISKQGAGGEKFEMGGPGPLFYLSRAALGSVQQAPGSGLIRVDRENGVWRFQESLTLGRALNRMLDEDAARSPSALPDLTNDITPTQDSNGDPWTNEIPGSDPLELPIGQSFMENLWELQDQEEDLVVTMDLGSIGTPLMKLRAWQSFGRDLTASDVDDFGSGVLHLKEGVNLEPDKFEAEGVSLRKVTHVLVHGLDGKYIIVPKPSWPGGDAYVKYGFLDYGRTKNEATLERRGLRWLRKQDNGEKEFDLPIKPGFDPNNGLYFPSYPSSSGHVWIGDLVSLTTGGVSTWTPLDYRCETQRVTNVNLTIRKEADDSTAEKAARSWDVVLGLNQERQSDNRPARDSGKGSDGNPAMNMLKLCYPATEESWDLSNSRHFYGIYDDAIDDIQWDGMLFGGPTGGPGGIDGYYFKSGSPDEYALTVACSEGDTFEVSGYVGCDSQGFLKISWFTAAPGSDPPGVAELDEQILTPAQPNHEHAPEWTYWEAGPFIAPAGATSWALGRDVGVTFGKVDVLINHVPAGDVLAGTGSRAARCDHQHHWFSVDEPTVDDDEADGYQLGTVWYVLDDVEAPTEVMSIWVLADATEGAAVWLDITPGTGGGGGGGHTIKENGTPLTARAGLNFANGLVATDDAGNNETDVNLDYATPAVVLGSSPAAGSAATVIRSDSTIEAFDGTSPVTQAFGDSAATGSAAKAARRDHKHGMPANPVTAHEAASDPHTGYVLESIFAAKGDLLGASANDTPSLIAAGSEGQLPVQRSAATPGVAFEYQYASLMMILGDGDSVVATGVKGYILVPFDCTIVSATLLADVSGSIVVDVWKDTYANYPPTDADSITASAPPTISSSTKSEDTTLTGWTTSLAAGDVLGINVDSASSVEQVTFMLRVRRS